MEMRIFLTQSVLEGSLFSFEDNSFVGCLYLFNCCHRFFNDMSLIFLFNLAALKTKKPTGKVYSERYERLINLMACVSNGYFGS